MKISSSGNARVKPLSYFEKKVFLIRPAPAPKPKPKPKPAPAPKAQMQSKKKVPKPKKTPPRVPRAKEKPSKSIQQKPKPQPKSQPKPEPQPRQHKRLIIKRSSGGVLPRSLAEGIMLKRMAATYPDIDASTVTNEMMDHYDQSLSFNENMNALSRLDQFQAYPAALEYRKDWEARSGNAPADADARSKDAVYREIDSRIRDILERYPEDFHDYLADKGLAEVEDS